MSNLTRPRAELVEVNPAAAATQRITEYVQNIELLCTAVHREILLLGQQLADCKWSGTYLVDPKWDEASTDPTQSWEQRLGSRSWDGWLTMHDFRLRQERGETVITHVEAANLMAWSACYGTLAAENERRAERGDEPLPLPSNPAQIDPYQGVFTRVDDFDPSKEWPEEVKVRAHDNALRKTEGPYAEDQSAFVQAWQRVVEAMPIKKRRTPGGELAPPARDFSRDFFKRQRAIEEAERKAKAAREQEDQAQKDDAITVGGKSQSAKTKDAGAKAAEKKNKAPVKSAEELEAEAFDQQLVQDIYEYRNRLHDLREAARRLEATLKNVLVRGGSDRLALMRNRPDMGISSVSDDIDLLRGAVETLQRAFHLATEPYTPPTPISREEIASHAVVDVAAAR